MASESIAHEAAIDSEAIRAQGIIVKYDISRPEELIRNKMLNLP